MPHTVRARPARSNPSNEGLNLGVGAASSLGVGGVSPAAVRDRRDLEALAGTAEDVRDLFRIVSSRLSHLIPFDAAVWMATDPATGLPTAPTRAENIGGIGTAGGCQAVWDHEYLVEDVNLFRALAQSASPAAALRATTAGRPERSARFRSILSPNGFGDELRAVLRSDGVQWGVLALMRLRGRPAFDECETEFVASLSAPLAESIRDNARPVESGNVRIGNYGPGLMVFGKGGEVVSMNDDAAAWLDELLADRGGPHAFGVRLPLVLVSAVARARALASDRPQPMARARVRVPSSGRWLVCHASALREPDGTVGETALVIEPAKASEVAPIIAQAYSLTPREQEITEQIAQGASTGAIAATLFLSPHTVRDYVKTVFDKVGVSSRGELVAKLFAEHYAPVHLDPSGVEHLEA
jgi:DNA-binding CsgD family transcriptional regulator